MVVSITPCIHPRKVRNLIEHRIFSPSNNIRLLYKPWSSKKSTRTTLQYLPWLAWLSCLRPCDVQETPDTKTSYTIVLANSERVHGREKSPCYAHVASGDVGGTVRSLETTAGNGSTGAAAKTSRQRGQHQLERSYTLENPFGDLKTS